MNAWVKGYTTGMLVAIVMLVEVDEVVRLKEHVAELGVT